jgi:hypothetical protein
VNQEPYNSPVGFAREPSEVRWRWVSRVALFIFLIVLVLLLYNGVLTPETDTETPRPSASLFLPGD